jgi:hypothetical protein
MILKRGLIPIQGDPENGRRRSLLRQFGKPEHARLAQISVAHLYNLRGVHPIAKWRRNTKHHGVMRILREPSKWNANGMHELVSGRVR